MFNMDSKILAFVGPKLVALPPAVNAYVTLAMMQSEQDMTFGVALSIALIMIFKIIRRQCHWSQNKMCCSRHEVLCRQMERQGCGM